MGYTKRLAVAALSLLLSGCGTLKSWSHADHISHGSGKLDKEANVLVVRGQDYYVCAKPNQTVELSYFLHFRWMGDIDVQLEDGRKFIASEHLVVRTKGKVPPGMMAQITSKLTLNSQPLELVTLLIDCGGAK